MAHVLPSWTECKLRWVENDERIFRIPFVAIAALL
jgi:hypothetical protein